ncbi:MAG: hypothetical protein QOH81_1396 [Sphingomonadales bacterium]|jgi:hypothetical protein|nr:hypothetical protein [Sphingomonadales bacterium]
MATRAPRKALAVALPVRDALRARRRGRRHQVRDVSIFSSDLGAS